MENSIPESLAKPPSDFEYEFSEEEVKLFEERRAKRLRGESKTFTWQEAKGKINGKET